jgi:two-component system, OmpR family, phosphate regulon sensor histidine kinase PhoR
MWPKKLIWQLYFSYLLIMGVPVLIVTWYSSHVFRTFYLQRNTEDLKARAILIGSQIEEHIALKSYRSIDSLCKVISRSVNTRFTVIAPSGKVIGDSERDPDSMENHATRPEVIAALAGKTGVSDRFSQTLMENMMYVAIPVYNAGTLCAVVRTALPTHAVRAALDRLYRTITAAVLFMALFAALISYLVSRKVSGPIAEMRLGAQRFASGDFGFKLPATGFLETDQLATSLNEMARKLSETIGTITEQRNELDAILASMVEGVIAIDSKERIITINQAAAGLFSIDPAVAPGKWIGEVLRNTDVQDFLQKTLLSSGPVEGEASLPETAHEKHSERFLQLHGSALRDGAGNSIGALMVVNDFTRIKMLENVRREFVANVSHELRTPLTSIKGFIETLASGAIDNKEEAKRFVGIIAAQVDRLNTIVDDLLSLSRIEQDAERAGVELTFGSIQPVLASAVDACRHEASKKHITIAFSCDVAVTANMEKTLLEQAVVNILDNAIKYSDEGKSISVAGALDAVRNEVTISVADQGIGIPGEHLERIFERFYRVDKARSRKLGGTGLGLSIVKHIVSAHNGSVSVESVVGKGSTFTIRLPAAMASPDSANPGRTGHA